jgi:large subunit ribosomal protein L2
MFVKKYKPYSNGIRHHVNIYKNLLSKTNLQKKSSIKGFKMDVGRSSLTGRITVRHKGGGCKKKYRKIEFKTINSNSIVLYIMYDPFRNSFVSFNFDLEKKTFFREISTNNVGPGSLICYNKKERELRLGNKNIISLIPSGTLIHSLSQNGISKYARSAGTFIQIIQKGANESKIKLSSGTIKTISNNSIGTIGCVSNSQQNSVRIGKAGRSRLLGKRPSVRGVAMNPVDHPHGGRTNGGRPSVTPWGIPTKGKPTVKNKK